MFFTPSVESSQVVARSKIRITKSTKFCLSEVSPTEVSTRWFRDKHVWSNSSYYSMTPYMETQWKLPSRRKVFNIFRSIYNYLGIVLKSTLWNRERNWSHVNSNLHLMSQFSRYFFGSTCQNISINNNKYLSGLRVPSKCSKL